MILGYENRMNHNLPCPSRIHIAGACVRARPLPGPIAPSGTFDVLSENLTVSASASALAITVSKPMMARKRKRERALGEASELHRLKCSSPSFPSSPIRDPSSASGTIMDEARWPEIFYSTIVTACRL
jgi:hypothetical protein